MTEWVIAGRKEVGMIVNGAVPPRAKAMVSAPDPGSEFTCPIAHRNVPELPSSSVLVTV